MQSLTSKALRKILKKLSLSPTVFIFLDYDGTLAPIAPTPEEAQMPASTAKILKKLDLNPLIHLAIVSGRKLSEISKRVRLPGMILAGNHGLEIEGNHFKYIHPQIKFFNKIRPKAKKVLEDLVPSYPGTRLEDKTLSLTFHYRKHGASHAWEIRRRIQKALFPWESRLQILDAKMAFEIRPKVSWDKGHAVRWILCHQNPSACPVYIGDDFNDESAFQAVRNQGVPIRVGYVPKSQAKYYVRGPAQVAGFLKSLGKTIQA